MQLIQGGRPKNISLQLWEIESQFKTNRLYNPLDPAAKKKKQTKQKQTKHVREIRVTGTL